MTIRGKEKSMHILTTGKRCHKNSPKYFAIAKLKLFIALYNTAYPGTILQKLSLARASATIGQTSLCIERFVDIIIRIVFIRKKASAVQPTPCE